jgi:hypothetical protein
MTVRQSTLRLNAQAMILMTMIVMVMFAVLAACGDPKAQPVAIVVTFDATYSPPPSLDTGEYAGIAADVANDNHYAGVNFSCAPAEACGSFTPTAAGSAIPVCYLAPEQVPTGNTVTVTATSVTDPTKSASATISIVSGPGLACP